ncbi:hypothetical protein HBH56_140760 [Parastagonospora nodorum]|uniref:RING-type domain-containing protein n=1 Tax=Phaeosphaeria nodorum (strain SN15 / ATCC MYA-4574 / FGSC 10173) TaxID=321614 RepID=A0A7U2ERQ4_PHANO|nr:hypothetical protein HBH56_140760 [Parastagonospora nodorum]QRC91577.1 hypothetical protein JI435_427110 [Parastagonospora nodorum SN15]KAH3927969.1 hypothetical protein HBH54_145900 [Parastagonospora nodorum]KAH3949011.1 hypothetical protein HBH53_095900 [Parastagonospora nodorum]KAH3983367.1 hypothetical protein HBH51_032250 [Parastagonospora nodorum]
MPTAKALNLIAMAQTEKAAHHHCNHCGSTHANGELPCQEYFLERHLIPAHPVTVLPSEGTGCGICLENISLPPSASECQHLALSKEVVFLLPCRHFFHQSCILIWHSGIRPERDTCPICRRTLFIADPLTPAQLDLLHEEELENQHTDTVEQETEQENELDTDPDDQRPTWVFMNGEFMSMDIVAGLVIKRESDNLDAVGHFNWYDVCTSIHTALLTVNGPLRPIFREHRDTFVLCVHAAAALVAIENSDIIMAEADRDDFLVWFRCLISDMSAELAEKLCQEMSKDGLFVTPLQPIVVAPWTYRERPHMTTDAFRYILGDVIKSREGREGRGLRARLRRVARKFWPSHWT